MDKVRDQPTRRIILDFVQSHPGASARDIQRSLSLGWGETAYHLDQLVRSSALARDRTVRRDYYFPPEFGTDDRKLVRVLQAPAERALLLALAVAPDRSFVELVDRSSMSRSTLAFHLRFLVQEGLVGVTERSGSKRYHAERPDRVKELHALYTESWGDRWVDRFTEAFRGIMRD